LDAGRITRANLPHLPRGTAPLLIFLTALVLRLFHDLVLLDMRVVHVGDSFNFLTTGSLVLAWLKAGAPFSELFANHATSASGMLVSTSLVDRLLLDGPVYPGYLAFLELLLGVDPHSPHFEGRWAQLAICNAVVDSLVCLGIYYAGRLAFGKARAILAAVMFALYPAAIINTQHCYVEPFAYCLLVIWICFAFKLLFESPDHPAPGRLLWLGLGITSGLMILAKPAFLIIPPLVVLALLTARGYRATRVY